MNWFREHLNITWLIVTALPFTCIAFESPIPYMITWLIHLVTMLWILDQKKRNWIWVLIPIAVLLLGNERKEK